MKRALLTKCTINIAIISFLIISFTNISFAQIVPSPEDYFGFEVGADYHLINYKQAINYWKKLESISENIKIFEYGKTSGGRPMIFAVISSKNNMAKLDRYKEISKRLSLVREVSTEEAWFKLNIINNLLRT